MALPQIKGTIKEHCEILQQFICAFPFAFEG
jgi:hypothetical protein